MNTNYISQLINKPTKVTITYSTPIGHCKTSKTDKISGSGFTNHTGKSDNSQKTRTYYRSKAYETF